MTFRKRRGLSTLTLFILLGFLSLVRPGLSNAASGSCSEANHCYALAQWGSTPRDGLGNVSGHLKVNTIGAVSGSRTNQEAWISVSAGGSVDQTLEQGIKYGLGPDGNYYHGIWFWEHVSPSISSGFHPTGLSSSGPIVWGFHYHGGAIWLLQRGDTGTYATESAYGPTSFAETGTEYSNSANNSCGTQTGLAYVLSGSTSQHFGWYYGASHVSIGVQNGPVTSRLDGSGYDSYTFASPKC